MNFGQPFTAQQTAQYLRTLSAIRERCTKVHELAKQDKLEYFAYHPEREDVVASFCLDIIKVRNTSLYTHYALNAFMTARLRRQLRIGGYVLWIVKSGSKTSGS